MACSFRGVEAEIVHAVQREILYATTLRIGRLEFLRFGKMADQACTPATNGPNSSPQPPTGAKKQQKQQQQKGQQHGAENKQQQQKVLQQGAEFSQQKGRIDLKVVIGSTQGGRPSAGGSAGSSNRQIEIIKSDSKQQVNVAGGGKGQQPPRIVVKTPVRLSLFDHLPRKQLVANPYSIEGDMSLHPATIKLGIETLCI